MNVVDIEDFAADFERLVEAAAAGTGFIVSVAGVAKVAILPLDDRDIALFEARALPDWTPQ